MKCGLLGRTLRHSYSPAIHAQLGDYEYGLYEKEPEEVADFLRNGDWDGLNVTMPYKKLALSFLDEVTAEANAVGAVNTIFRRNGKSIGHNTDLYGFQQMLLESKLQVWGKKCLVLGSGGASAVVCRVLKDAGAHVIVISRSGENNYHNIAQHQDAAVIVNATPVGMYPDCGVSPVDLDVFPHLEGVLDVIYNPARTQLLIDAQHRGIIAVNGLRMLVAQAKAAAECFTGATISNDRIDGVYSRLKAEMENIILIGMPGCGKSTVGQLVAAELGREYVDADAEIEKRAQKSIPRIFAEDGEAVFRMLETQVLAEFGKQSGLVIATGGGCVTRAENDPLLHQNGCIFWLERDIEKLATEGRPLSVNVRQMYNARRPMYESFTDVKIDNNRSPEEAAADIRAYWEGLK